MTGPAAGFLGPAGTFSEQALLTVPDVGERVPFVSIRAAIEAVAAGTVPHALVPMENAIEGAVDQTLDALADAHPAVAIAGELVLGIRTCLIVRDPSVAAADVELVLSHPQPLGQCAAYLRRQLPRAATRAAASTAEAVREVVDSTQPWAALAPRAAAERWGATVLADGIDDDPGNRTRFVWVGASAGAAAPPAATAGDEPWRTSVLFAGAGDGTPGWLVRCLSEFAFRGVNLTRIESRPLRATLGHYRFFVDAEGAAADGGPVAEAIASLRAHCDDVRVLGSYPAAATAPGSPVMRTGSA